MHTKRTLSSMGAVLALGTLLALYARANPPAKPVREAPGDACAAAYPIQDTVQQPQDGPAMANLAADQVAIPPIDAWVPADTETATFALG